MNFLIKENMPLDSDILKSLIALFPDASVTSDEATLIEEPDFRMHIVYKPHLRILKLNIEAKSKLILEDILQKISDSMKNDLILLDNLPAEIDTSECLVSDKKRFDFLLRNLWYTWNPHYILPIIDMYGDGWRRNKPPEAIIVNYGKDKLKDILFEKSWELKQNCRLFHDYLNQEKFFNSLQKQEPGLKISKQKPIAYFCLEYGLNDWMQIYSGGLGILAGDYLKETSDMGIPVIGIGIFYHEGYFHQDFTADGYQIEDYLHQDPLDYNLELVKTPEGKTLIIPLQIGDTIVNIRFWKERVGLNELYLIDTNFEENDTWESRMICAHLYGGDLETRIKQEILLGIGGAKLLEELGIVPTIYHMNEGHSSFLILELVSQYLKTNGGAFKEALGKTCQNLVFTNHTLKQAGNDVFDFMLFEQYIKPYISNFNISVDELFELGKDHHYAQGGFSMTIFALRNAKISNSVSILHGKAAKNIWPEYNLVPVTNGVHLPTWVSPEIHAILDEYLGENWHNPYFEMDFAKIQEIPLKKIWDAHKERKLKLINSLNHAQGLSLNPDYLTIAWSRRLAAYKRPDLLISDLNRLEKIVNNSSRPVQILIAGKSHPKDGLGKQILQRINHSFQEARFNNKVEVIPGYNWQLARRMVSGADVWLNTPYRYEEACGTSGMKAAANGVVQFTTMDGWTDEVDWYKIGWVIGEQDPSRVLYDTLENEIAPLFYNQNEFGFSILWVKMMLNSIHLILKNYSTTRMVKDYLDKIYLPIIRDTK